MKIEIEQANNGYTIRLMDSPNSHLSVHKPLREALYQVLVFMGTNDPDAGIIKSILENNV